MVDLAIIKSGTVRVLVEIEESNTKPNHICGKALSAGLSTCLLHRLQGSVMMANKIAFVQVLDTARLPKKSSKRAQWQNLEGSIQGVLPLGKITCYRVFPGNAAEFQNITSGVGADLLAHLVKLI